MSSEEDFHQCCHFLVEFATLSEAPLGVKPAFFGALQQLIVKSCWCDVAKEAKVATKRCYYSLIANAVLPLALVSFIEGGCLF